MTTRFWKFCLVFFAAAWPFAFGSCGAAVSGVLERGGSGNFEVSAALSPAFAAKMREFVSFAGGDAGAPLIDAPEIARSLSGAPGMGRVSFRNAGPAGLEGPVTVARLGDFLSSPGSGGCIDFAEEADGGRMTVTLDRETVPAMLGFISPSVVYYLNFLFAPVVTGEQITEEEYLTQIGLVYNLSVAEELARSEIRVSVTFPGPLVSVRGGTFSGAAAEFAIPLIKLLVLAQPLGYEAVWR
ncbi:MAG: hypothetical protein LBP20_03945 [Treponema sp.]|jgi:hypothetical protein|nr:hypothetical protein [Treponema sp.]